MWQIYAMIAFDLARERTREAQVEADHRRLLDQVATARALASRRRTAFGRAALASLLRRLGGGADAVAAAACRAASRLDGQVA
jgi:hypothetical protein